MTYLVVASYVGSYLFAGLALAWLVGLTLDTPAGERFMEWLGL